MPRNKKPSEPPPPPPVVEDPLESLVTVVGLELLPGGRGWSARIYEVPRGTLETYMTVESPPNERMFAVTKAMGAVEDIAKRLHRKRRVA